MVDAKINKSGIAPENFVSRHGGEGKQKKKKKKKQFFFPESIVTVDIFHWCLHDLPPPHRSREPSIFYADYPLRC